MGTRHGKSRSTSLRNFVSAGPDDNASLQDEDEPLLNVLNSRLTLLDAQDEEQPQSFSICVKCRTLPNYAVPSGVDDSPAGTDGYFQSSGNDQTSLNARRFRLDSRDCTMQTNEPVSFDSDQSELLINEEQNGCVHDWEATDHCHSRVVPSRSERTAQNQLIAASILCLLFTIAEAVGGYLAGSVAVMTDAAHMLSDFASFLISLSAIWIGRRPPSKRMSFGYHRAEVLGALISTLVIWILTGILVYVAVDRIIYKDYAIDADTMIIVSAIGVAINIVMGFVLHGTCHAIKHSHGHSHGNSETQVNHVTRHNEPKNINVRAAFIHVVGDLIQSVGVLIAAYVIKYYPNYKIADPICTFIFSVLVLLTTVGILRDSVHVLMEGFPKSVDYASVQNELLRIEGVVVIHSLHIWTLTIGKNALAVHVAISQTADADLVLKRATVCLRKRFNFLHTTIQVEKYDPPAMSTCPQCQIPAD